MIASWVIEEEGNEKIINISMACASGAVDFFRHSIRWKIFDIFTKSIIWKLMGEIKRSGMKFKRRLFRRQN
jgi:hypothetical protein